MAYHYDNRRLNFLRSHDLVELIQNLGESETVEAGLQALPEKRRPAFTKALAALAASDFLVPIPPMRAHPQGCEGTKQHTNPEPQSEALEATRGGATAPPMRAHPQGCEGTKQHTKPEPQSEALEATRGGATAPPMRAESK